MTSAPSIDAAVAISTPRLLAVRASGRDRSTRHTPTRSSTSRSAHHGGGASSTRTPIPTSADDSACGARPATTATVAPFACNCATASRRSTSSDPLEGSRSSNAERSPPSVSTFTDTTWAPDERACASTAAALGWCAGVTSTAASSSTAAAATSSGRSVSACQPTPRAPASTADRAASHTLVRSASRTARIPLTRSSAVCSTDGSTTTASTRSRQRSAPGRRASTAWRSASPRPSVAAKASRAVRAAFGAATRAASAAPATLRVAAPTAVAPTHCAIAARSTSRSTGPDAPRGRAGRSVSSAGSRASSGSRRCHTRRPDHASAVIADRNATSTASDAGARRSTSPTA